MKFYMKEFNYCNTAKEKIAYVKNHKPEKRQWRRISRTPLPLSFIRRFKNQVNWMYISGYQKLTENFIREFQNMVYWTHISISQILSEDFIREFQNKINFIQISSSQVLSEDFMAEFADDLLWSHLQVHQDLSEDFIRRFQHRFVEMRTISFNQKVSEEFCREFEIKYCDIKGVVHHCGHINRTIKIFENKPDIIHIGCFKGTRKQAIKAVSKRYKGKARDKYIQKINECFKINKEKKKWTLI